MYGRGAKNFDPNGQAICGPVSKDSSALALVNNDQGLTGVFDQLEAKEHARVGLLNTASHPVNLV